MIKSNIEKKKRGLFIVFEGADKSGKSTQAKMLGDYFAEKGESFEIIAFPLRSSQSGQLIDDILKSNKTMEARASHLLFSLNRWEKRESMLAALESGSHLIVDRYAFSGVVYTISQKIQLEWAKSPDMGLIRPDIVFHMCVDIEKIAERKDFGKEVYETIDFQSQISQNFEIFSGYKYWKKIDASKSEKETNKDIVQSLESLEKEYASSETDDFKKNFYPYSIGEDLFMYHDI